MRKRSRLNRKKMVPIMSMPGNLKGTIGAVCQLGLPVCRRAYLPVCITFAMPPVAIVIVKKVHVKCRNLSFHSSFSKLWVRFK